MNADQSPQDKPADFDTTIHATGKIKHNYYPRGVTIEIEGYGVSGEISVEGGWQSLEEGSKVDVALTPRRATSDGSDAAKE